jgi:flavin reductase (DIM6/NTAB) family NADH-FMN oxidoreductase RutF
MTGFEPRAIDEVFQLLDRPVWIITAAAGQRRGGLVATWVSQAALDAQRPVLLTAIAPTHFTAELILESRAFAAHLLAAEQIEHVWRFGLGSGRGHDKLAGIETVAGVSGSPILPGVLAWLDCRMIKHYDAGDRLFFWADVLAGRRTGRQAPLRENELLALASPEQKRQLKDNLLADIGLLRPLADAWRQRPG